MTEIYKFAFFTLYRRIVRLFFGGICFHAPFWWSPLLVQMAGELTTKHILWFMRALSLWHFSCLLPKQLQLAMNKSWNQKSNQRPWSSRCIRLWVWVADVWWSVSEKHLLMQDHYAGALTLAERPKN